MSIALGVLVSAIVSRVRTELSDTGAVARWSDATILNYLNDAIRDLAEACVFRRRDIIVPTAGRSTYAPHCEPVRYFGVMLSGRPLIARTESDLYHVAGSGWEGFAGTTTHYVPGEALRLWPAPGTGTALTWGTAATLTENEGRGPGGSGYTSGLNGTTLVHWLPGDGVCTNETASGNLWIDYAYYPGELLATEKLSRRYVSAVQDYAVGLALEKSEDAGEQRTRDRALQRYYSAKEALASVQNAGRLSAEYLPAKRHETSPGRWDILSGESQ